MRDMKKNNPEDNNFNVDLTSVKESAKYRQAEAARKQAEAQQMTRWGKVKAFFGNERTRLAMGVVLMLFAAYLFLSFLSFFFTAGASDQNRVVNYTIMENAHSPLSIKNAGKAVGASLANFFISDGVGVAALIIVWWLFVIGLRLARKKKSYFFSYSLMSLFSIFTCSMIVGACTLGFDLTFFPLGGEFGKYANTLLLGLSGIYGMIAVNFVIAMVWVLVCYNSIKSIYHKIPKKLPNLKKFNGDEISVDEAQSGNNVASFLGDSERGAKADKSLRQNTFGSKIAGMRNKRTKPVEQQKNAAKQEPQMQTIVNTIQKANGVSNPHDPTGEYMHYKFPSLDLLQKFDNKGVSVDVEEQEANKQRIIETLNNYKISVKSIQAHVGPTVTLFEIVPEDGIKVAKIKGLEDDIAMSLSALGIRIIAPMPGRGTIGIEVPNHDPQVVPMRDVLESKAFQNTNCKLPMVLGCTVSNEVFVADLTKMPHLLVAGATGQGKSVGLNAIIASLLYKKGPSELKFVLVDPKKVEFSLYSALQKYYLAMVPDEDKCIVTDTDKVVKTLNCVVQEMENRYRILEQEHERKVEDYNRKWKRELRNVVKSDGTKYEYMPYIVVIIDEFSDLIMTAGKEVETPIVRIAQKARAVGIHMIIATQRPSREVITGLIKANFPGRVAFRVTQMQDSRIILDRPGAQSLIGRGDMLFSANGEITRLQCPFVDTPDVERICDFIAEQEDKDKDISHEQPFMLPEYIGEESGEGGSIAGANTGDRDPLFAEAARWIVQSDVASTSSLQRRYSIGYNRAGRLMDQMEAAGIVSASQGGKPRTVLMDPVQVEQMFQ